MLRMETENGWWLITHPDHARLAGAFARAWGNQRFRQHEPRSHVLRAIACHDDGWRERDASPKVTREGLPSAFSLELVGSYSAFEEIDLAEYLAVRARAVRIVAADDPYAGLLIAIHTSNLLSEHVDRARMTSEQRSQLDDFLLGERNFQQQLLKQIHDDLSLTMSEKHDTVIQENFRLLQACDNLSLLTCVAFDKPSDLLHSLPLLDGSSTPVQVFPLGPRHFRLTPWPFDRPELRFEFPARHVIGRCFSTSEKLAEAFHAAPVEMLSVHLQV